MGNIIRIQLRRPESTYLSTQSSGEINRTRLTILKNYKTLQSIISVNTNIFLRRVWVKFLRIMYGTRNAPTSKTLCILLKMNYERHRSFYFCRAILSTHSFFCPREGPASVPILKIHMSILQSSHFLI
jgi:hypothetical protein